MPNKAKPTSLKDSIRSGAKANKGKQKPASGPYGGPSGGGLADSLSSLFNPAPHGKDAALASLLAKAAPPKPKQPNAGLQSLEAPPARKQKIKQESEQSVLLKSKTPTPTPALPLGRKLVFRPVLASPFAVTWPEVPQADAHTQLHRLLDFVNSPEAKPHLVSAFGKLKDGPRGRDAKKARLEGKPAPKQERTGWFVAGINSVTRTLEEQQQGSSRIQTVYVCRDDADPMALVAHFPMLACSYNAKHPKQPLRLVPLPKGSEALLCQALGLKHCAVLALTDKCTFAPSLPPTCTLTAAWLETALLQPTRIKFLRSSAPIDLNAAKLAKKQRRQRRKQSKRM